MTNHICTGGWLHGCVVLSSHVEGVDDQKPLLPSPWGGVSSATRLDIIRIGIHRGG